MKRRMYALGLALLLACSMSTVALAESRDVTIQVVQASVYDTKIEWQDLNFVYTYENNDGEVTGNWNKTSATVTVKNDSPNASIQVASTMDTDGKGSVGNVNVSYNGNAVPVTLGKGEQKVYTVSVSGEPANVTVAQTIVGVITVTIS